MEEEYLELERIKEYKVSTPKGSVMVLPIVKNYGKEIVWEIRGYKEGAMGPFEVDKEFLGAINAPETWLEEAKALQSMLQEKTKIAPPKLIERAKKVEQKALEEAGHG